MRNLSFLIISCFMVFQFTPLKAEHIALPDGVDFILLNSEVRKALQKEFKKEKIDSPVLRTATSSKGEPNALYEWRFYFNNFISIGPDIRTVVLTATYVHLRGTPHLQDFYVKTLTNPPVSFPNNDIDRNITIIFVDEKFNLALNEAQKEYRSASLIAYRLERKNPTESERQKDITDIYEMDLGMPGGAHPPTFIRMRVAINALDVTYPRKVEDVVWSIEDSRKATEIKIGALRNVKLICQSTGTESNAAIIVDWDLDTKYVVTVAAGGVSKTYVASSATFLKSGELKELTANSGPTDESGDESITIKYIKGKYAIDGTLNGLPIVPRNKPDLFSCQSFTNERD